MFWTVVVIGFIIYIIYIFIKDNNSSSTNTYTPVVPTSNNQRKRWDFEPKEISKTIHSDPVLEMIKKAIDSKEILNIKYRASNGFLSNRNIKPIKIMEWGRQYYLRAFCLLRNEERTFKINRIQKIGGKELVTKKETEDISDNFEYKEILIVEADEKLGNQLKNILRKNKAKVKVVTDGISALETFKKNRFDFIYLNLTLPFASGIEVLRNIKKKKLSDAPVVIFTNSSNEKSKAETARLGADGYYEIKNQTADELISAIEPFIITERK